MGAKRAWNKRPIAINRLALPQNVYLKISLRQNQYSWFVTRDSLLVIRDS